MSKLTDEDVWKIRQEINRVLKPGIKRLPKRSFPVTHAANRVKVRRKPAPFIDDKERTDQMFRNRERVRSETGPPHNRTPVGLGSRKGVHNTWHETIEETWRQQQDKMLRHWQG